MRFRWIVLAGAIVMAGAGHPVGALAGGAAGAAAEARFVEIGTGGVTGVYYPTGGAICRMVNARSDEHGIRCSVETTGGSIDNIEGLRAGTIEFGIAQSDWQYHAYNGTSVFSDKGQFEKLRAVFSVYAEPVTILARADAGIANITDLKGKRVNIGNPGSGTRGTWEVIERALGWTRADLAQAAEMQSSETGQALCGDRIDAYFWLVGHPSALTEETLSTCDAVLVEASGPEIERLLAGNPFYRKVAIPAGLYNNARDIGTFGVSATLVTSADTPEDVVYTLARAVLENFEEFRTLHPAFAGLRPEEAIREALTAPMHPGAIRAYRDLGLM